MQCARRALQALPRGIRTPDSGAKFHYHFSLQEAVVPLDNTNLNGFCSTFLELAHHPQARYSDFASLIITIQIDAGRAIFDIPDSGTLARTTTTASRSR